MDSKDDRVKKNPDLKEVIREQEKRISELEAELSVDRRLSHYKTYEKEIQSLKADNERLMMIQKAIHKSADASKNEWVPKSEIESLRSKLADREVDTVKLCLKLEKLRGDLKRIYDIPNDVDLDSDPIGQVNAMYDVAKQTLKDISEG